MKKFIPAAWIAIITFSGCSTERDDEPLPKPVEAQTLLTKITTKDYEYFSNPIISVKTFTYNTNSQLTEISSETERAVFEYDNSGKPMKTVYHKPDGSYMYTKIYVYEGDKLTKINSVFDNTDINRTSTYTYNTAGQLVSVKTCEDQNCNSSTLYTYTYSNKNISTSVFQTYPNHSVTTREYTFDDKKSPYSTLNPYIRIMLGSALPLNENNHDTQKILYYLGTHAVFYSYIYTNQYNSQNFPTFTMVQGGNVPRVAEYLYEYTIK